MYGLLGRKDDKQLTRIMLASAEAQDEETVGAHGEGSARPYMLWRDQAPGLVCVCVLTWAS